MNNSTQHFPKVKQMFNFVFSLHIDIIQVAQQALQPCIHGLLKYCRGYSNAKRKMCVV